LYAVTYKAVDNNSIRINNKDSAALRLTIAQLPPLDDLQWYKIVQGVARGLMMVRSVTFSYTETQGMMIPGFRPEIGDFFGQGATASGRSPGLDFAFGLTDEKYIDHAFDRGWLITDNMNNTQPAMFNKAENFTMSAVIEPFMGMKINLNANRTALAQNQIDFMYAGMPKRFSGNFNMTTIALSSAFEPSDARNGYYSKSFETFLNNREVIAGRLENRYNQAISPSLGVSQNIERNSADVLVPAFLAAYTGKDAHGAGLDFLPSLLNVLPNWDATYEGLIQLPFINKHFKSFSITHGYKCRYSIGSYTSYPSWTEVSDGIGYIRNMTTDQLQPSSPYNVMAVSIVEAFDPLIRINSVFLNNMSLKAEYKTSRNVNLNISSYQIVEMTTQDFGAGIGYRIDNFDKIIKFPKKQNPGFNNELRISADLSYRLMQSLNRKIQDAFTQPTTGNSQMVIKLTADYSLSKMVVLQAFYDRQISTPLVSSTAFPQSKSAFGVSVRVNLMQ
jgi:cell surface protein SprA